MKLPFGMMPGSWGLTGKTRETAQAEYELKGEALERRLAEIHSDADELAFKLLKLDRKYKHVSKEEYDYKLAELQFTDEDELTLVKLELDKKYGKLTEHEYDKALYSYKKEPWVGCIGSEYDPNQGTGGFSFELDWNSEFVEMCIASGYNGVTDEQIVEQWFEDIATEEYYKEMMKTEQEYMEGTPVDLQNVPSTKTTHERIDDKKTKHS